MIDKAIKLYTIKSGWWTADCQLTLDCHRESGLLFAGNHRQNAWHAIKSGQGRRQEQDSHAQGKDRSCKEEEEEETNAPLALGVTRLVIGRSFGRSTKSIQDLIAN